MNREEARNLLRQFTLSMDIATDPGVSQAERKEVRGNVPELRERIIQAMTGDHIGEATEMVPKGSIFPKLSFQEFDTLTFDAHYIKKHSGSIEPLRDIYDRMTALLKCPKVEWRDETAVVGNVVIGYVRLRVMEEKFEWACMPFRCDLSSSLEEAVAAVESAWKEFWNKILEVKP